MSRTTSRRPVPTTAAVVVAAILAFAVTVLVTPAADAAVASSPSRASTGPFMNSTGSIRDCVKTNLASCASRGSVASGRAVTMHCWVDGSTETGTYASKRWFYVTVPAQSNLKGYVHSSRVSRQASVPACSATRGIAASTWASERVGAYDMSDGEWTAVDPSHAYSRAWSGGCAGFAYLAYLHGAKVRPSTAGDAGARYQWYQSRGRITTSGTPQIGSIVFWPTVSPWGHAAVYVGNGYVASTTGYPGERLKNARVKMSSFGTPAGWVEPGRI